MKIVMQHGHAVARSQIESFLETAPKSWSRAFDSIIVYKSVNEPFRISFHPKEKILGIHISEKYTGNSKKVIEEVAIASQAIEEHGHLPNNIARQKEYDYRQAWSEIGG